MTWEEVCNTVINYYREHESEFDDVIKELNSYTGILEDNEYYMNDSMEEINYLYRDNPTDALIAAMAGRDETYNTFDTDREFYYEDGEALISTDDMWPPYADYTDLLDEEFVKQLYDNRDDISLDYTIEGVFDAWAQQEGDS